RPPAAAAGFQDPYRAADHIDSPIRKRLTRRLLLMRGSAICGGNEPKCRGGGRGMQLLLKCACGAVLIAACVGVGTSWAQDVASVVESRQNVMKSQGKDMAAIKAYVDDKGD